MNETMMALVFTGLDEHEVRRVPVPRPDAGEVLIRVDAAGVCHTDLDILAGRYSALLPRIPGHEVAGTIVAVGDAGSKHRIGEMVAVDPLVSCGTCRRCLRGLPNLCTAVEAYGAERDGGFAEYVAVRSGNATDAGSLPASIAALAEPFACAMNALGRVGTDRDMRVAVVGAGPMGMILAIALRGLGIDAVTVADRLPARLERASRLGATDTVVVEGALADTLPERSFDLVIDATGRAEVVQQALSLLDDAGTLVPFGVCPPGSALTLDPFEIYRRQLRIVGSFSLARGIPEALRVLQSSALPLDELVTDTFALDDAAAALGSVGTADAVKLQIDPRRSHAHRRACAAGVPIHTGITTGPGDRSSRPTQEG